MERLTHSDMLDGSFPRVLIVSAPAFSAATGTGITLANLFQRWPTHLLSQAYLDPDEGRGSGLPSSKRLTMASPASLVAKAATVLRPSDRVDSNIAAAGVGSSSVSRLRVEALAALDTVSGYTSPSDEAWARGQSPDVIYTNLGSIAVMRATLRLSRATGAPIVPHFMDDWPATLHKSALALGPSRTAESMMRRVLSRSGVALAISPDMCNEYGARYGHDFKWISNPCPEGQAPPSQPQAHLAVFVGGLHLGRAEVLDRIARTLEAAGSDWTIRCHLPESQRGPYARLFDAHDCLTMGDSLTPDQVPEALVGAQVLLHLDSSDPNLRKLTRLSLSTKLSQYLWSGRPILAVAPGESASAQHVMRARAGLVVDGASIHKLPSDIDQFDDLGRVNEWSLNAQKYALENHLPSRVVSNFKECLARGARNSVDA